MAIQEHPPKGSILLCDFKYGFKNPEMDKLRPVVILSPKIKSRHKLCTIVPLSTTPPHIVMPYHAQIDLIQPLPRPYNNNDLWVKGDMINTVGFHRLDFIKIGKDFTGKRLYHYHTVSAQTLKTIQKCVMHGLGLSNLTKHL